MIERLNMCQRERSSSGGQNRVLQNPSQKKGFAVTFLLPAGSESDGWMSKREKKQVVKRKTPSRPPSPAGQVHRGASGLWIHKLSLNRADSSCTAKLLLTCSSMPTETFEAAFTDAMNSDP